MIIQMILLYAHIKHTCQQKYKKKMTYKTNLKDKSLD